MVSKRQRRNSSESDRGFVSRNRRTSLAILSHSPTFHLPAKLARSSRNSQISAELGQGSAAILSLIDLVDCGFLTAAQIWTRRQHDASQRAAMAVHCFR